MNSSTFSSFIQDLATQLYEVMDRNLERPPLKLKVEPVNLEGETALFSCVLTYELLCCFVEKCWVWLYDAPLEYSLTKEGEYVFIQVRSASSLPNVLPDDVTVSLEKLTRLAVDRLRGKIKIRRKEGFAVLVSFPADSGFKEEGSFKDDTR